MKKLPLLLLLGCLMLSGCRKDVTPAPSTEVLQPTQSQPAIQATQPQTRSLFIRTGIISRNGDVETRTEYRLNEYDRITEVLVYTDSQLTQRYSVQSDADSNPTHWISETSQIHYTYADDQLKSYTVSHGTTVISTTEYTYQNGLLLTVTQKMPVQSLELRQERAYDGSGHLLRQEDYRNGTLQSYTVYTLNEDGTAATATTYLADGTVSNTATYGYDGLTVTATATNGSFTRQVYDENGHLLSSGSYTADGIEITCQEYEWTEIQVPAGSGRISI